MRSCIRQQHPTYAHAENIIIYNERHQHPIFLQSKLGLHGTVRSGLNDGSAGGSAEGILGAVLGEVEDVPEVNGEVIPGEGIEHGVRVGGGVHAGEAAADLGGQPTLGGKAHGQGGAVQAADGIEVEGVGRTRHPLHPVDGVGPPGGRGEVGAVRSL